MENIKCTYQDLSSKKEHKGTILEFQYSTSFQYAMVVDEQGKLIKIPVGRITVIDERIVNREDKR